MARTDLVKSSSHAFDRSKLQRLDEYLNGDASFITSYARALASIASHDGEVTIAEFGALTEIAKSTADSAVVGAAFVFSAQSPGHLGRSLEALKAASKDVPHVQREAALEQALPLLALQGFKSSDLSKRLAGALGVDPERVNAADLPPPDDKSAMVQLGTRMRRLFKRGNVADSVEQLARQTGDVALVHAVRAFESGLLDGPALTSQIRDVAVRVEKEIQVYENNLSLSSATESIAKSLTETAEALEVQVEQRLALVAARIQQELDHFDSDIEELVYDAGNALELGMADRLSTDKWKQPDVWLSIANTQFGKEMERRIDRFLSRKEESLRLLKEDLRLFQNEVRITHASLGRRQHHSQLAKLMPGLRTGTRVLNAVDTASEAAIAGGVVATGGIAAVGYFAGAAIALPLATAAAPYIGGAVLLGGLFKWLHDSEKLKKSEVRHKRATFESHLRQRLEEAHLAVKHQYEETGQLFQLTAVQLLLPVRLEAEAADRLIGMQQRVAGKAIRNYRSTVKRLQQEFGPDIEPF